MELFVASGGHSEAYNSKPRIDGMEWLWEAYWDLSTCRVNGMSMGQIPWTAIMEYVDRYEFDDFEEEMLRYCIYTLDKVLEEKKS